MEPQTQRCGPTRLTLSRLRARDLRRNGCLEVNGCFVSFALLGFVSFALLGGGSSLFVLAQCLPVYHAVYIRTQPSPRKRRASAPQSHCSFVWCIYLNVHAVYKINRYIAIFHRSVRLSVLSTHPPSSGRNHSIPATNHGPETRVVVSP